MTIIGLAIVGVGLWALMFYSTPPSNLEPYENYQESQKKSKTKSAVSYTHLPLPTILLV